MASRHGSGDSAADLLAALAALASAAGPAVSLEHVERACAIVRDALTAGEAYILRAGDPAFVRLGSDADPTAYEIKQKGYYLIWRALAAHPDVVLGGVRVAERLVQQAEELREGARPTHLVTLLPGYESNAEMLVVRGEWPDGIRAEQMQFLQVARPLLASLVSNMIDAGRQQRLGHQLGLLADVATAFSQAREIDGVLPAVATAVAKASGFDWVTVVLFDAVLEQLTEHATSVVRHADTAIAGDVVRGEQARAWWLRNARWMRRTGRPLMTPDVFAGKMDDASDAAMLRWCERAHILSTASFPIRFQDRFLGVASFAATTRHLFDPEEVEFLTTLVAQAAASIGGLRLHHDLKAANTKLAHMATHDTLTGLPNRALLRDRLQHVLSHPSDDGTTVALLFLDLDNFKVVNDTLGHPVGDQLLVAVAERLRSAVRPVDTVARFGGDEFVVLVHEAIDRAAALRMAERVLAELRAPLVIASHQICVEASVGIALRTVGAAVADDLLREADAALYQAKGAGKGQAVVF